MRAYGELICDITKQVTQQWRISESFAVRQYLQEITLRVILQAVFGLSDGSRYQQLRRLISSMLESISSPLTSSVLFFPVLQKDWGSLSPWGRYLRQKQQVDQLIYEEIRERREKGDFSGNDILTLMMSARDEAGQPMTDDELHDELITLLVAGHETTASALTWALYWVHHLPDVHDKLLHELNSLGDDTNPSEIAKLPYLTAVCQETLRIYPIVISGFFRVVKAPFQVMGYQLEPGTALIPSIYLTHHREDIYPEAKRFKPERFLERQFSQYEYLPFGGGNRRCIGMAFAQFEMKLVLGTIVSQFELALADRRPVKPVRRGFTVAPPSNMRMVVTQLRPQNTRILV
jgi:cytochrome P450